MVIFIELVQYAKNINGKSRKTLVEHPIIKNDKKIKKHHLPFFHTLIVKITHSVCYMGPYRLSIPKLGATNS